MLLEQVSESESVLRPMGDKALVGFLLGAGKWWAI